MRITLVSPHTKGSHVKALQRVLHKHGYLQGKIDGEYGPDVARAVFRAKYWFGYRKPDQVAGDLLYSLLKGTKKMTPAMKVRQLKRKRVAKKTPIRLKMWAEAGKQLGQTEHPPNSNRSKFSLWYGIIGAWCAMFVSWCGVAAKSVAFKRGKHYAYVPYMANDAKAGRNNLAITYKPETGDTVTYDWDNDGVPDHTGLFGRWLNKEHTRFLAREGNTGHSNRSNGGMSMEVERSVTDVYCFIHVGK